jgi:hypothetical protein
MIWHGVVEGEAKDLDVEVNVAGEIPLRPAPMTGFASEAAFWNKAFQVETSGGFSCSQIARLAGRLLLPRKSRMNPGNCQVTDMPT